MKSILSIFVIFITLNSYSQDQVVETTLETPNFAQRWWESSKNKVSKIWNEGRNDLYLTLVAYHDRNTYTPDKLKDLNEKAYGFGLGKTKINENGNTEMLFAMTHLDSHRDVQFDAGYAWVKKFDVVGNFKLGVGYAAGLVSRSDMANRIPIPFALPLATVDVGDVSVNAILIPKLNDGINNGNVLFVFGKFTWDGQKI